MFLRKLFQNLMDITQIKWTKKNFLSLFSHPQDDLVLKWSMPGPFLAAFLHVLFFKELRDPVKCIQHGMHYFIAHLLRPKMIRNDGHGQLRTALLYISCVPKRSVANTNKHEFFSAALLQISCLLKWSGTSTTTNGYLSIVFSHIPWALKWSGTCIRCQGPYLTALLHIFSALKWAGTSDNKHAFFSTALLHIIWHFRQWPWVFFDLLITHFLYFFHLLAYTGCLVWSPGPSYHLITSSSLQQSL